MRMSDRQSNSVVVMPCGRFALLLSPMLFWWRKTKSWRGRLPQGSDGAERMKKRENGLPPVDEAWWRDVGFDRRARVPNAHYIEKNVDLVESRCLQSQLQGKLAACY